MIGSLNYSLGYFTWIFYREKYTRVFLSYLPQISLFFGNYGAPRYSFSGSRHYIPKCTFYIVPKRCLPGRVTRKQRQSCVARRAPRPNPRPRIPRARPPLQGVVEVRAASSSRSYHTPIGAVTSAPDTLRTAGPWAVALSAVSSFAVVVQQEAASGHQLNRWCRLTRYYNIKNNFGRGKALESTERRNHWRGRVVGLTSARALALVTQPSCCTTS